MPQQPGVYFQVYCSFPRSSFLRNTDQRDCVLDAQPKSIAPFRGTLKNVTACRMYTCVPNSGRALSAPSSTLRSNGAWLLPGCATNASRNEGDGSPLAPETAESSRCSVLPPSRAAQSDCTIARAACAATADPANGSQALCSTASLKQEFHGSCNFDLDDGSAAGPASADPAVSWRRFWASKTK